MDIKKYTGIYATSGDVRDAVSAGTLHNPYMAIVQDGNYIDWNGNSSPTPPVPPTPVYSAMPLTFEIISGGTIYWEAYNNNYTRTIQYKKNDGAWTNITSKTLASAPQINVNSGDKVMFRGNNAAYSSGPYYTSFSGSTGTKFEIEGNIMSLIDSTGYTTATTLTSNNNFYHLFRRCDSLITAENLVLPATTLTEGCYQYMFLGCTSLTSAPELPATTLTEGCYKYMFSGCTSLTTAPELPATTLVTNCYTSMFQGCSSLNVIKCLANYKVLCTINWVSGVATTGTFVKKRNETNWKRGDSGIPNNWTVIDADI